MLRIWFKIKILDILFYGDITGHKLYPGNIGIAQTRVVRIGLADVWTQRPLYNMMAGEFKLSLANKWFIQKIKSNKALK